MRRIDEARNKKMRGIKYVEIIDKKRLRVLFTNGQEITLVAEPEDFGYDAGIYIEKDNKIIDSKSN